MPRAGGRFNASYNVQTGVDETARIVVAPELPNSASDTAELRRTLRALRENVGVAPDRVLTDIEYQGEQVFVALAGVEAAELIAALGGRGQAADPVRCAPLAVPQGNSCQNRN